MKYALCAPLLALALGCAGSEAAKGPDMGGEDGTKVAALVDDMNDAVGNPRKVAALFAAGGRPPDAAKTKGLSFSVVNRPAVTGAGATCKVRVDRGGGKVGEPDWSFVKEGDKWKIKSAPLP